MEIRSRRWAVRELSLGQAGSMTQQCVEQHELCAQMHILPPRPPKQDAPQDAPSSASACSAAQAGSPQALQEQVRSPSLVGGRLELCCAHR